MNLKKKFLSSVAVILLISLAITTISFAIGYKQQIWASFNNIKIYRNGEQVQLDLPEGSLEPFIVNSRTYVPLRAIAQLFDKEVLWDGTNYRIDINDKPWQGSNQYIDYLLGVISEKQEEINKLKSEIKELEDEIKDLESKLEEEVELPDVEKKLNKNYNKIDGVKVEIELDWYKDDIEVTVWIDYDDYADLDLDDVEDYLYDLYDEIEYYFEGVEVYGYFVSDDSYEDDLLYFEFNSKGKLVEFDDLL